MKALIFALISVLLIGCASHHDDRRPASLNEIDENEARTIEPGNTAN